MSPSLRINASRRLMSPRRAVRSVGSSTMTKTSVKNLELAGGDQRTDRPDVAVRDGAHVAGVEAALLEDVAHALEHEGGERRPAITRQAHDLRQDNGAIDAGQLRQVDQHLDEAVRI